MRNHASAVRCFQRCQLKLVKPGRMDLCCELAMKLENLPGKLMLNAVCRTRNELHWALSNVLTATHNYDALVSSSLLWPLEAAGEAEALAEAAASLEPFLLLLLDEEDAEAASGTSAAGSATTAAAAMRPRPRPRRAGAAATPRPAGATPSVSAPPRPFRPRPRFPRPRPLALSAAAAACNSARHTHDRGGQRSIGTLNSSNTVSAGTSRYGAGGSLICLANRKSIGGHVSSEGRNPR